MEHIARRQILRAAAVFGLGAAAPLAAGAEAAAAAPSLAGATMVDRMDNTAGLPQMAGGNDTELLALVRRLADEAEIRRVVDEIDNTVDAKDWVACRGYFLDDITVDFSSLVGGGPGRMRADDLVGGWRRALYSEKRSAHMRSNHRVQVTGDRAEVFSRGYAFNLLPSPTGSDLWEVWGDYRHTLERTPQGWKVASMSLDVTYARGNERARDYMPQ